MKDTQIHVEHRGSIVPIDIAHGDNSDTMPDAINAGDGTPILASAEAGTITARALGAQMQRRYPGRTFYVWSDDDYVFAYSHPSGRPPRWKEGVC